MKIHYRGHRGTQSRLNLFPLWFNMGYRIYKAGRERDVGLTGILFLCAVE